MQEMWVQSCSGKLPHASGQLSLCSTTTESELYSPCSTTSKATAMRSSPTKAREMHCKDRPSTAKVKKKKIKNLIFKINKNPLSVCRTAPLLEAVEKNPFPCLLKLLEAACTLGCGHLLPP